MRLAIMGGTLDPVHNGHLEIARAVKEVCRLDGVVLLPAGDPPHKKRCTDRFDRLEMAKRAVEGQENMWVSDREVLREGTTYTVDTLTELHREHPDVEWIYIIGADTVNVLDKWKDFGKVAKLCSFAAVERPGYDSREAHEHARWMKEQYGAEIRFLNISGPDISSTMVRERAARAMSAGEPGIDDLVPAGVADYIREKGLYLCDYSWEDLENKLSGMIKPSRFVHTMGVVETAVHLAKLWGECPQQARLAAMLHDCAKSMSQEEMAALIREYGIDADEEELAIEPVVHAPAGAALAQKMFGVKDPEVISAIRNHTLGGPGMTDLDRIIYVADFIEPNRKPFPGLDEVRALAQTSLRDALIRCTQLTIEHTIRQGGKTHPRTAQMIEEL